MATTPLNTETILYQSSDVSVGLQVRLANETVWLTQKQIAELFGTEVPAISKHIRNIFSSGELQPTATVSKMEIVQQEGKRRVVRAIDFYNLDIILSVGYRVNSKNATQFRIWANKVLKDYLLKGYAINYRFESLENRVSHLEVHQTEISEIINKSLPPKEGIFFDGQIFDAYELVSKIIKSAKRSILLLDNYVDETTLLLLAKRGKNVKCSIYTPKLSTQLKLDVEKHNAQYASIMIVPFNKSHDRFLILDHHEVYHIGASLKDAGKKWFAFTKLHIVRCPLKTGQWYIG